MQKSLIQFEETIKTEATRELYRYTLNKFLAWSQIRDFDSILKLTDEKLNEKLIGYIIHLKELVHNGDISPNTVPKYFNGIEHFLVMNDRIFNWSKLHKMYPAKRKEAGSEAYTTQQIQQILSFAKSARTRFIITFLCSTGARLGALADIKLKHVKKIEDCHYVTLYAGEREEAVAFLTPEASRAYDTYMRERERDGERFTPESPLFRAEYRLGLEKVKHATKKSIEAVVYRLIQKAVIERTKEGKRYNIQADHGFRKWYKIQIANTEGIPLEMSKKLIQHRDLEGKYNVPRPEMLFVHFKKAIQNLTIDETERQESRIRQLESEKASISAENQQYLMLFKIPETPEEEKEWAERYIDLLQKVRSAKKKKNPLESDLGRFGDF